jgi:hypothetical protein
VTRLRPQLRRVALPAGVTLAVLVMGCLVVGRPVLDLVDGYIALPGGPGNGFFSGDSYEVTYHWWMWGYQVVHFGNPWADPLSFGALVDRVPNQFGLPFSPFFGLLLVGGIPFAFNVMLLLTFPLTALFAYLWLRSTAIGRAGALTGALLVAFFPPRIIRLQGHYIAWLVMLVPLALWMLERAARAETERARRWWSLGFVLTLLVICQSGELYFTLFAVLIIGSYAALRLRTRLVRDRSLWVILGGFVLAAAVLLVIRGWLVSGSFWSGGRPLIEAALYSPEPGNFVDRDPGLGGEKFTYLGVLALVGAPLGLLAGWRRRQTWFWAGWIALLMVFGLGTSTGVFTWLHENTPLVEFARSVTRPLPLAAVGLGFLAGLAVDRGLSLLRDRRAREAAAVGVCAVAGVVAVADTSTIEFSAWSVEGLRAQRELLGGQEGSVLSAPVFDAANTIGAAYLYASMLDPRRSANGYSPYTPALALERQEPLRAIDCGILGRTQREALARYGLRHLLVYPMFYGTPWTFWSPMLAAASLDRAAGITKGGEARGVLAWRVEPDVARGAPVTLAPADLGGPVPTESVLPCTGFASPDETGVWTHGGDGYLWAIRPPGAPAPRVRLQSGPIVNRVRYGVVDGPARTVTVAGQKEIALPVPPTGRWTPMVISPERSWKPYGTGPEDRGVRLVFPLPRVPGA